jgi:hypothetical protein
VFGRFAVLAALLLIGGATVRPQSPASPPETRAAAPAAAQSPSGGARSPRNASYSISARLDPSNRTLTGEGRLTWRNTSNIPATTLRFHLYYNAWRNTRSSWMRERRLSSSAAHPERPQSDWGWIDLTRVRLLDPLDVGSDQRETIRGQPPDLMPQARFIAPDDGNPDDRTVLEVPIAEPVAPGETIAVGFAWTSRVPRTFARTGAVGNFYFIAQWFPKIGVLEDSGWNCHQFHSATEFFADFGSYDVRLTVPRGWIVGATGTERDRRDGPDGTTTHHYQQDDVHDFAWTTSPDFIERRARFEHPSLPAVEMRLLLQPEHGAQADRHFEATRAALKHFGEWYGAYPYGHVTIVDPAWNSDAGGMEYPTLFTAGTRWRAPDRVTAPEGVTVHEAGHQWWYGVIATNEFEHAWMDEGLTTFSTARTIERVFEPHYYAKRYFGGFVPWVFRDFPLKRETAGNHLDAYRPAPTADDQSTPTWRYWPGSASVITYSKTALWLHTLERMLGWDTLQRILSTYYSRWAFRHPKPEDFFAVVNDVSGRDLTWFFDQVHRSSNVFDYGVDTFRSEPQPPGGLVDATTPGTTAAEPANATFRTTVVVRRFGEGLFPVDVRVVFENAEELRWQWDGRDRWKLFEIDRPVRAAFVQVDPDRVLLLDVNGTNNSATLAPKGAAAARKWSLAWLVWLQDHLLTYGFFV